MKNGEYAMLTSLTITFRFEKLNLKPYHVETMVLVRSPKLSNITSRLVTIWNTRCCKLGCVGGLIDNGLELDIRKPSSNSSQVHYSHLHADILGKSINP